MTLGDVTEYQQPSLSNDRTSLKRNLEHPRSVPEEDSIQTPSHIDSFNSPARPLNKKRRQSTDGFSPNISTQKRQDKPKRTRSRSLNSNSESVDVVHKLPRKKRRLPVEGLFLGPYRDDPKFAEPDEGK